MKGQSKATGRCPQPAPSLTCVEWLKKGAGLHSGDVSRSKEVIGKACWIQQDTHGVAFTGPLSETVFGGSKVNFPPRSLQPSESLQFRGSPVVLMAF